MIAYIWFINIANYEDWYPVEDIIYSSPLKALCAGFKYGGYSLAQIGIERITPWLDDEEKHGFLKTMILLLFRAG